jgi:hypothetical protein
MGVRDSLLDSRMKRVSLLGVFGVLWFIMFPLLIHLDGNIVEVTALSSYTSFNVATKYYYMALFVLDSFIILVFSLYVLERRERLEG